MSPSRPRCAGVFASGMSLALGVLATLAPKCPLCLAAYLSLIGVGATAASILPGLLFPGGVALIGLTLGIAVYHFSWSRRKSGLPKALHECVGSEAQRLPGLTPLSAPLSRH